MRVVVLALGLTGLFSDRAALRAEGPARILTPVAYDSPPVLQPPVKISEPTNVAIALPLPTNLFRVESEQNFRERLRQELPNVKNVRFPGDEPFVTEAKTPDWPARSVSWVMQPICYRPLHFEDRKTERDGIYVPCLQPLVSTARFYGDFLALPWRMATAPPWTYECAPQ